MCRFCEIYYFPLSSTYKTQQSQSWNSIILYTIILPNCLTEKVSIYIDYVKYNLIDIVIGIVNYIHNVHVVKLCCTHI